jgi:hypothetical protein
MEGYGRLGDTADLTDACYLKNITVFIESDDAKIKKYLGTDSG